MDHILSTPADNDVQLLRIKNEANIGFSLYIQGKYAWAAKHLKRASMENHPLAQDLYADICLRDLDGKVHAYEEAAMWYLLSALGGDPNSRTYLNSIIPDIFALGNSDLQMAKIVDV